MTDGRQYEIDLKQVGGELQFDYAKRYKTEGFEAKWFYKQNEGELLSEFALEDWMK